MHVLRVVDVLLSEPSSSLSTPIKLNMVATAAIMPLRTLLLEPHAPYKFALLVLLPIANLIRPLKRVARYDERFDRQCWQTSDIRKCSRALVYA